MTETTFTFRVDKDLKSAFASSAKAHDRQGAQLLRDFMRTYVAQQQAQNYDSWLTAKVDQSRASAEAGDLIPAAEVETKFAARRAATLAHLVKIK